MFVAHRKNGGVKMTKHNLKNPRCPDCKGISQRLGFLIQKTGKVRRYHCIECGRSFTENTQFVKLADIPQHLEQTILR